MGIQINGQTDTVTSTTAGGSVKVTPLAASTGLNVGTGASVSSPATNVLTLGTNNAERVRIGSTGSVGIGTNESYGDSNASFTSLSLGGNGTRYGLIELNKSDGIAGSWIDCYGTGGNGDLRITTAGTSGAITFWTGGEFTEKVRINSSGNVGINSTSPRSKLDVGGELILGRQDSSQEGGQITLCRSSDNASTWSIDAYGSTSTPSIRFVDNIAGASRMEIDGSGRVTMPYQPYFYADMSSDFTTWVPNNQTQAIVYNRATINIGNHYSTTTGLFTAPVTGVYQFYVGVYSELTSFEQIWYILNGARMTSFVAGVLAINQPGAFFVKLSANDTVGIHPYVNIGSNRTITVNGYHTFFYGHLVG